MSGGVQNSSLKPVWKLDFSFVVPHVEILYLISTR